MFIMLVVGIKDVVNDFAFVFSCNSNSTSHNVGMSITDCILAIMQIYVLFLCMT